MALESTIHEHHYQHFPDLQLSAKEFYDKLQILIASYQYPDVACKIVELSESGLFSSKREYLKISKQRYSYLVCASPFGKSFFISWWLKENANTAAKFADKLGKVGKAVAENMESKTYYEVDTQLMFTTAINMIIKKTIEQVTAEHGYRTSPNIQS